MRAVIRLNKGLVQDIIYSADDEPDLSVVVIDRDVEDLEDEEIVKIDGVEYFVSTVEPEKDLKSVNKIFKMVWGG